LFRDKRFGTNGRIPKQSKLPAAYTLSHERSLYLRLTSPHEYDETPEEFFEKIRLSTLSGRWAVASPLQPNARNKMPDVVETVRLFIRTFGPERVRVCFLVPNQAGDGKLSTHALLDSLWKLSGVECISLDARTKTRNGLVYADFFDYT